MRVWLSSDVCPEIREFERASTTVVNAYVAEAFAAHQDAFEGFLKTAGYTGEIRYLQSNGGLAGSNAIRARPVAAMFSGPAAGPSAGMVFANRFGYQNAMVIDMGGTSFDACVVTEGMPEVRDVFTVGGHRVRSSAINVASIGAGGGSIAWVDRGLLRVGPRSAEAEPGPACYGKGGTAPTVTDADLVLGYLNPEALLGGALRLRSDLAHTAIQQHVAEPLGTNTALAALGIFEVVNRNMADAMGSLTLGRGRDPRDYILIAGGGAGPVHAGMLAQMVGIRHIIVPKVAAELCAFGGLVCDLRHDYRRSCVSWLAELDLPMLRRLLEEMEQEGTQALQREGASSQDIVVTRVLDLRYKDQMHETPVDISDLALTETSRQDIENRFHNLYYELYQYAQSGQTCEVINARVTVIGRSHPLFLQPSEKASGALPVAMASSRAMLWPGISEPVHVPVYQGSQLKAGHVMTGPGIIEEPDTTIVIFPNWQVEVASHAAYLMTYTV